MDGLSSALCSGVSGHLCLSIKSHSSGMNIHGCSTQKAEQTWSETTFMFHREYHESRVGSYVGQNPSAPCLLVLHLYNYPDSGHGGLHDISTAMDPSRSSLPPWPSAWQRAMLFSHIHKLPLWDLTSSAASWTDESCPALPSPPWEHWTSMKPALTIEWKGLQWTLLSSASWTVCPHRASLPSGQSAMFPISSGQGTNAQPHLCSFSCVTFPIPLPPPTTIHQRGSTCEFLLSFLFSSVQSLSHVRLFATPWIATRQASLSITNSRSLLKPMSIKSMMASSHLILCCPLLLLPPIPPSIRVFSNEATLRMRWPKYWSFSLSISPSNEHPGLIGCISVTRTQSTETPDKVRSWNKLIKPHWLQPRLAFNPTTPWKAFMSQNLHFLWFLSIQTEMSKHKHLVSCFFLNPSVWELSL